MATESSPSEPQEDLPRPVDLELIRPVSQVAALLDAVELKATIERRVVPGPNVEIFQAYRYVARLILPENEASRFAAVVDLECRWFSEDEEEEDETPIATASSSMMARYALRDASISEFEVEHLELFAEVNGVYNLWPFLREAISTLSARMDLRSPLLPLWYPPATLPPKGSWTEEEEFSRPEG